MVPIFQHYLLDAFSLNAVFMIPVFIFIMLTIMMLESTVMMIYLCYFILAQYTQSLHVGLSKEQATDRRKSLTTQMRITQDDEYVFSCRFLSAIKRRFFFFVGWKET